MAEAFAIRSPHQLLGHDGAPDMIGDGDRRFQRRARQRDDEFLAAVTRGDVAALDVLFHGNGDEPQHLIAGKVADTGR